MAKNYYEILGVEKNATPDQIKAAYRQLAKKYHPDLYTTKPEAEKKAAEEKFKEINHAYEVLSDDQKRAAYDAYGDENGPQMGAGGFTGGTGGFGFDMDDIFSSIFSGFTSGGATSQRYDAPQRGRDILVSLTISFEEAVSGIQRIVSVKRTEECSACHGTGAKDGKSFKTCPQCGGRGQVTSVQRTPFGQISTTNVCPTCKGKGKVVVEQCSACAGQGRTVKSRDVKVNIPAGIDSGQRITYKGEGNDGSNGGERGNLIVELTVKPHKLFKRKGNDLYYDMPISFVEAALGCSMKVPTPYGEQELKIPEDTQSGTEFKIKNCGMTDPKATRVFSREPVKGDLYVRIVVEIPKNLTREQKDLLGKLKNSLDSKQFPMKKAFEEKK